MNPHPDTLHSSAETGYLAEQANLQQVTELLARQKRVESLVSRQARDGGKHQLIVGLVHQQHLAELRARIDHLSVPSIVRLIEELPGEDCLTVWHLVAEKRGAEILALVPAALRTTLFDALPTSNDPNAQSGGPLIHVFEYQAGCLRHVQVRQQSELAATRPIWVDLLAPSAEVHHWIEDAFGLHLPDPADLTDLESSARFYIDDSSGLHIHSDFLLDQPNNNTRNIAVAFILHRNILFSVRNEELPVFRLQRLRTRIQPRLVSEGVDILLALYEADIEQSADKLEEIYAELEKAGHRVLSPLVSDEEAAKILAEIARGEDLNGRIRRNILDTRRALSFLMRSRILRPEQQEDTRQILRDIESLDGHTTFLFNKINFLMDATIGFININQNRRVSRLTTVGAVFTPMMVITGIGGMSEFSMMTGSIPWPVAYGSFVLGMVLVGFLAYRILRVLEYKRPPAAPSGSD